MIVLFLLYKQLGIAFLSGVFVSILLIPINKIITTNIGIKYKCLFNYCVYSINNIIHKYLHYYTFEGKLTEKLMNEKDKRVKLMSEIIRGVRVIKFHVWEKYFIDKVNSELI